MQYLEIAVSVAVADRDTTCDIMSFVAKGGIAVEDYSDLLEQAPKVGRVDYYDAALLAQDRTRATVKIYLDDYTEREQVLAYIDERLTAAGIKYTVATLPVDESDYAEAWKKHYKPERMGERLVVCPSWIDYAAQPDDLVVRIDPGMAFGSGTHETTRLCARALERAVTPGCAVLDMGCGSGILTVCAAKLGAGKTVAVDIDPVAVRVAKENTAENGVAAQLYCGDVLADAALRESVGGGFDVIAANIVADVLCAMAQYFYAALRDGGTLIASGIIDFRADDVRARLSESGFAISFAETDDEWLALSCVKQPRK